MVVFEGFSTLLQVWYSYSCIPFNVDLSKTCGEGFQKNVCGCSF